MKLCGGGKKLWSVVTLLQRGACRWCCSSVCAACDYECVIFYFFFLCVYVCVCVVFCLFVFSRGCTSFFFNYYFQVLVSLALTNTVMSANFLISMYIKIKVLNLRCFCTTWRLRNARMLWVPTSFYNPEVNIRWGVVVFFFKKCASRLWLLVISFLTSVF